LDTRYHKSFLSSLTKQCTQSICLWSILLSPSPTKADYLHEAVSLAYILEEHISQSLHLYSQFEQSSTQAETPSFIYDLLRFYNQPELSLHRGAFSTSSLTTQFRYRQTQPTSLIYRSNFFDVLSDDSDYGPDMMDIDNSLPQESSPSPKQKVIASWTTDAGVSELSDNNSSSLQQKKRHEEDSGELEPNSPNYEKPQHHIDSTTPISQHLRFNLIHHRGVSANIPVLKLFKSFTTAIKKADPTAIILPVHSNKQHFSSLSTLKHIQLTNDSKMSIYFKSYHQRQLYSLSGFFHISLKFSLAELQQLPLIDEWLDTHQYFLKPCPSQTEEMIQIGALCYSSTLIFWDDLKQAIYSHPLWTPTDLSNAPIFDIYIGDFNAPGKCTKMLFFSAERSKTEVVTNLFKTHMMVLPNHTPMVPLCSLYLLRILFTPLSIFGQKFFLAMKNILVMKPCSALGVFMILKI
jgi:hypothetical protein